MKCAVLTKQDWGTLETDVNRMWVTRGPAKSPGYCIYLRYCGPVGVVLDALAQLLVGEDVVRAEPDAVHPHDLHDGVGEAASWLRGHALHEDHHVRGRHQRVQPRLELWGEVTAALGGEVCGGVQDGEARLQERHAREGRRQAGGGRRQH